jgi:thiamine pyrophosphokinase
MKNRASGQSKYIAIVAGGTLDLSLLPHIRAAAVVIGVDRGALWLVRHGVSPDVSIGDFDSVTLREKKRIHNASGIYMEYQPEKDATDLELAIDHAISLKPKHVMLFGALGRRFDHAMGAVHMLLRLESHNIYGVIVDNFSKINIVRRQQRLLRNASYPYVSVIPVASTVTVTLKGFVYDLIRKPLHAGTSLGISNEISGKSAIIDVHRGLAIVIRSTDVFVR